VLKLTDNGADGVLTLSATALAIIAPCLPTEERAHNPCQRDLAPERRRAVLDNQRF
jgi:hypothetical protein